MRTLSALAALLSSLAVSAAAQADQTCRLVSLELTPTEGLQMVAWIEDSEGNYVDTAYITQVTGRHGLGNRPGIMEFNSGFLMPYGRRTTTFPVWAHRHGMEWPLVLFQDEDDQDLSHSINQSSLEQFYCRPIRPDEALWDATSCATVAYTDKGKLSESETSLYPPRSDLTFDPDKDDDSVQMMSSMNPFDAVSRPTPLGGEPFQISWPIPDGLPDGDYVVWLEVSKEFDQNDSYDYPSPAGIPWSEYGAAYRGQPSVLYKLDFSVGTELSEAVITEYVGYGDPDGLDGEVREPDPTITTDTPGSGAGRLLIMSDEQETFRLRVRARSSDDDVPPGGAGQFEALAIEATSADLRFIAPGDDDQEGRVASYEVRYLAGEAVDEQSWDRAAIAAVQIPPLEAGTWQEVTVDGLLPNTNYYFAVRAVDECFNQGPIVTLHVPTPRPMPEAVDACFVATAAYASVMASEVTALRRFRDRLLRTHIAGELAVEGYYTFGPALAALVGRSELLRRSARAALEPLVERAATLGRKLP